MFRINLFEFSIPFEGHSIDPIPKQTPFPTLEYIQVKGKNSGLSSKECHESLKVVINECRVSASLKAPPASVPKGDQACSVKVRKECDLRPCAGRPSRGRP